MSGIVTGYYIRLPGGLYSYCFMSGIVYKTRFRRVCGAVVGGRRPSFIITVCPILSSYFYLLLTCVYCVFCVHCVFTVFCVPLHLSGWILSASKENRAAIFAAVGCFLLYRVIVPDLLKSPPRVKICRPGVYFCCFMYSRILSIKSASCTSFLYL